MQPRLVSLDVFRGLTIASMILVNNPGSGQFVYPQLRHSAWHGCTFTDLVFPFFLWIAGVAITFSFARRLERGAGRGMLLLHALRRSVMLFVLGLLLSGFPHYRFESMRIPGILQRIALCTFFASAVYLYVRSAWWRAACLVACLVIYTALMHPGGYGLADNFAKQVDALFLSGHMYSQTKTWDPEGIVSTLPAIATTLFGVLTGMLLRSPHRSRTKVGVLVGAGAALALAGLLGDAVQPINKGLWTPTYALFTAGLASLFFGAVYWITDVQGYVRWGRPFEIYGSNAIVLYTLSGVLARGMATIQAGGVSLQEWVFRAFMAVASPIDASWLYGLANVAALFPVAWILHRRGWFVRF